MSRLRRDRAPNTADHPPKTETVPRICASMSKWQQYGASISRGRTAEKRVDLARENEQRTSRMRDKAGVGRHLLPWIGRFFSDLERAEAADFCRRIGMLGRTFMDIETEAFALPV